MARRKVIVDTIAETLGTRQVFLLTDTVDVVAAARRGGMIPLTMGVGYPIEDLQFAQFVLSQRLDCSVLLVPWSEVRDWAHVEPLGHVVKSPVVV